MTWVVPGQISLLPDVLYERFVTSHHQNPGTYVAIVAAARAWKNAGHEKCSMKMLFEHLRWESGLRTDHADGFLLNNSHTAFYARLVMANEADLKGLFDTRQQEVDWVGTRPNKL